MASLTIPARHTDADTRKKRRRRIRNNLKTLRQNKTLIKNAITASTLDTNIKDLLTITLEMWQDFGDFIKESY